MRTGWRRGVYLAGHADRQVESKCLWYVLRNKYVGFTRFVSCGFDGSKAWTMVQVYDSIPIDDRQRIEKLEMLDECELLVQLFQHYCISIAWKGDLFQDMDFS